MRDFRSVCYPIRHVFSDLALWAAVEPSWGEHGLCAQITTNLGMNVSHVYRNDIPALVQEYYQNKSTLLFYWWTPDRLAANHETMMVRLPDYNRSQWGSRGNCASSW